jgi:hypothetical protein
VDVTGLLLRTTIIVFGISRSISFPIIRISEMFRKMSGAEGDLTSRIDVARK